MSLSVPFTRDRIRESVASQGLRLVTAEVGWCWRTARIVLAYSMYGADVRQAWTWRTVSMVLMYSKHGADVQHAWCWHTASHACGWDGDRWSFLACQLLLTLMFLPHHSSWPSSSSIFPPPVSFSFRAWSKQVLTSCHKVLLGGNQHLRRFLVLWTSLPFL